MFIVLGNGPDNPSSMLFAFHITLITFGLVWFGLVWFYSISTIVNYLMLNPVCTYISNIYNLSTQFVDTVLFIMIQFSIS